MKDENNTTKSLSKIAKILGAEGFNPYLSNKIKQYWQRKSGLSQRQQANVKRLQTELTRIASTLSEGDRLILGKFIGLRAKQSFDVGLKTGLMTHITEMFEHYKDIIKTYPELNELDDCDENKVSKTKKEFIDKVAKKIEDTFQFPKDISGENFVQLSYTWHGCKKDLLYYVYSLKGWK